MPTSLLTRRSLLAAAPAILRSQSARRPNILFVITDDQSWVHCSAYGSKFVRTPAFDRLASEGVRFTHAFVSVPSCAPSRGSVLTGQDFYRLGPGSMNHTEWPRGIETYPDLLSRAGYHIGATGKGWDPGNWRVSGRQTPPCGPEFDKVRLTPPGPSISDIDYTGNFAAFLDANSRKAPFCFHLGINEPHRVFDAGLGVRHGKRLDDVVVPAFLPDSPEVRSDLADYAFEIEWYDRQLARTLELLEKRGELENTLIVATSDNGMAFPRAKGNLYEYGVHMPLAIRWGARIPGGRVVEDFVTFPDFAPTFLQAAGLAVPSSVTGRSLLPLLHSRQCGAIEAARDSAVFGIERHFPGSRPGGAGYPARGIRTRDFHYIRNLTPGRNPCGDRPGPIWPGDDPVGGFGDTDGGPAKTFLWEQRQRYPQLFQAAFGQRPAEELYDARTDPHNLRNLAADPRHAATLAGLRRRIDAHLTRTADPRVSGRGGELDAVMRKYPSVPAAVSRQQTGRR
jgi:uncharacterized sulfatase